MAGNGRGVGKIPVDRLASTREEWTRLLRFLAGRHDNIETLSRELVDRLAALPRNIQPELVHHGDGFLTKAARPETSALYVDGASGHRTQESLGHLRTRRVVHAQEEHAKGVHGHIMRRPYGGGRFPADVSRSDHIPVTAHTASGPMLDGESVGV